jgi:hypothetical protein
MLGLGALIGLIICVLLVVVFFTQLLWNNVMTEVFEVKQINFWQTIALLILSSIFFGGHCSASNVLSVNNMTA